MNSNMPKDGDGRLNVGETYLTSPSVPEGTCNYTYVGHDIYATRMEKFGYPLLNGHGSELCW